MQWNSLIYNPKSLRTRDYEKISASKNLFDLKFDETIDAEITYMIDSCRNGNESDIYVLNGSFVICLFNNHENLICNLPILVEFVKR